MDPLAVGGGPPSRFFPRRSDPELTSFLLPLPLVHTQAENERMHLMSFMTLAKPGLFFRALILGAQGG